MESTIHTFSWRSMDALVLESSTLRVATIPQLGGKIVSLCDKRSGREWLVATGGRELRPIAYGASFVEQDMSGWDEMFPTIVACAYPGQGEFHGAALPDHGEVWTLPWVVAAADAGGVTLAVEGRALSYRLTRTLTYSAADTLALHYHLSNLTTQPMPYMWAAHPQFACGDDAEIVLPPAVTEMCNTLPAAWGWGAPETRFGWPVALVSNGQRVRLDRVGPPALQRGRKFFAPPATRLEWAVLVDRSCGDWLRLGWDAAQIPYFGLWVDEGALSHASVVAPEPTTGFYDSLAVAWQKQEVTMIEPGATHEWLLTVRVGAGDQPIATGVDM